MGLIIRIYSVTIILQFPPVEIHVDGILGLVLMKPHTEGGDETAGEEPLDLSGGTVRDEAGHTCVVSDGSCWSPAVG